MAVSLYEIDFRGKVMWVTYGGDLLECMCSYIESNNYVLQNSLLAFVFNSSSLPLLLQNPLIGSSSVLGSWKARKWPSSRRPLKISTTLSLSMVSSLYV